MNPTQIYFGAGSGDPAKVAGLLYQRKVSHRCDPDDEMVAAANCIGIRMPTSIAYLLE
jgi:hypothetical protein